uniref:Uncharacterized protein n=1 Tax=Arundo donax TaxID=35708 RepID=A0A0A9DJV6_ARUDO
MPKSKASDYPVRRIFDRLFPMVFSRLGAYIYPISWFIWCLLPVLKSILPSTILRSN